MTPHPRLATTNSSSGLASVPYRHVASVRRTGAQTCITTGCLQRPWTTNYLQQQAGPNGTGHGHTLVLCWFWQLWTLGVLSIMVAAVATRLLAPSIPPTPGSTVQRETLSAWKKGRAMGTWCCLGAQWQPTMVRPSNMWPTLPQAETHRLPSLGPTKVHSA